MRIKLSDYILEQSISDAGVNDILLEQAIAEVEVTSAICEAYMKQMILEADDETVDDKQSSSGQTTGFVDKVERFVISIGNWFRRMWIKFTGWLSERKLARIVKKLEAMSPEEQKNFTGTVPFATPEDAEAAIKWFNDKTVEFDQRIDKIAEGEEYNVRDLQADLSTIKSTEHSEYKPTETPVKMNYESYLDVMKRLLDGYSKNKESIKNTTESMKQDKFKNLAAKMNGKDPKEVKAAYSYIKKIYQKYSAESSKFINMLMKYLGEAEMKGLFSKRKKKSKDKDGNVDVTNAFIKSIEAASITSHGISSSGIVTNILSKINVDSNAIVTLYENQYVTGKSDSEKIACIEKCINHIKDNYSSSKLIDLINEYVSGSNNPSILSKDDNDKKKLYTEKLINYLKKYEITDIMRVAIILESMRRFDDPVKMFEHFGYKNMTVDKLRKIDEKLVEQLREFNRCVVNK